MGVAHGSECLVPWLPMDITLGGHPSPMIHGVGKSVVAGLPAFDHELFAAPHCHRDLVPKLSPQTRLQTTPPHQTSEYKHVI